VKSPGNPESGKTRVLEAGTDVLQNKAPVNAMNVYVDGFHFYSGNLHAQMEAHHYCTVLNEDLNQCVIFDGNAAKSKLMGVEYIISRKLFETLPPEERRLWHSHNYEVVSGELIAPGVPKLAEHAFMEKFASTYGKTWHTWNTDQGLSLPTGTPMLMMGFTADGQIDPAMVANRDRRFGVSTESERQNRRDIHPPAVAPGANAWEHSTPLQVTLQPVAKQPAVQNDGGRHVDTP
jgi:hypothetical protein